MKIQVISPISKEEREIYFFNVFLTSTDQIQIVFTEYQRQEKPSPKKMWKMVGYWNTYDLRNSTTSEPILPSVIKLGAEAEMKNRITVMTWGDFQKGGK